MVSCTRAPTHTHGHSSVVERLAYIEKALGSSPSDRIGHRARSLSTMSILFSDDSDSDSGSVPDIVDAIYGQTGIESVNEAVLGEPKLQSIGEGITAEPYIEVPTYCNPEDITIPSLYFDLPDGPDDVNEFTRFINALGIQNVADIDLLDGEVVPLTWDDGVPHPDVDEILELPEGE